MEKIKEYINTIYKYRFYIALIIFVLCVLFEISGSSIGMWKSYIDSDTSDKVLLGTTRGIRSDEWAVYTPMMFSQIFDGFKYFSDIIRGGNTDVFMIYGLPVLNVVQIFRPFQIGFLFLGAAKGLSFFWCGRFIALFLVMLELGMVITNKNKLLSFLGAIIISLSPIIQWWYAVNGLTELFIFGGLIVILLKQYMITNSFIKRCLFLALMIICFGGYAMALYPSWQVPMAYAFLPLVIWIIVENKKLCKITIKDIVSIILAISIFIGAMIYIYSCSSHTIHAIMNTVYPGSRSVTGGDAGKRYFYYITNIFTPFKDIYLPTNPCEESLMFSLFPAGIIISLINIFKSKKRDVLSILLLIIYAFLGIWCFIGFPKIIAKITLLSFSQAARTMLAVGFLEILILIRSLSIMEKPLKRIVSIIISLIVTAVLVGVNILHYKEYLTIKMIICLVFMCIFLFYFLFRYKAKYAKYIFTVGICFVMIMCGATVNPIRSGVKVVFDDELIKEVRKINENDNGNWITEGMDFPNMNYILMAGVPTINCTNVYPDLEKWEKIDEKHEYEDVYNRYAHIVIKLKEKPTKEKFKLLTPDSFEVDLNVEELKKINVKYIFTENTLDKFNTNKNELKLIKELKKYKIYKVN